MQAIPTTPMEPGHWDVPGWLALPPVGAFMLGTGLLACVLSWWWAGDASTSAVVTQRVLAADETARHAPLPPGLSPTGGGWIKGTSQHLSHWAIVTAATEDDAKGRPSKASELLTRALEISPLNPTARLAIASSRSRAATTRAGSEGWGSAAIQ